MAKPTEDQIRRLRISLRIGRDTYERALWGDEEALAECAAWLSNLAHREFVEKATP